MRRPHVLVWDDEALAIPELDRLEVLRRTNADEWRDDLLNTQPILILLDNDMGARLAGWEVLAELRRLKPDLAVLCTSRNPAAIVRMEMDGAFAIEKEDVGELLAALDQSWTDLDPGAHEGPTLLAHLSRLPLPSKPPGTR